jgi:hypothetical protein
MASQGETLVDVDFSAPQRPKEVPIAPKPEARVTGVLPEGWIDDSGWCPAEAEYSFGDEQGTRFLQAKVTRLDEGRVQLAVYPIPDAPGDRIYRLSITCRNRTGVAVGLGLRRRDRPWTFYWSRQEKFSPNWETRNWEFRLPKNDMSMGIWINLGGVGEFDIAKLKLERFSEQDLVDELKAKYPDGGPANLVRRSRFPLGLPMGWALDRDDSDGDVAVTEAGAGENALALRLASAETMTVRSAPIGLVYPIVTHTASLAVRGTGTWKLEAFGPSLRPTSREFTASDEWTRVDVQFRPRMGNPFCQVGISGTGELYVDKLQVGPSNAYTGDYVAPAPCEIAAALADGYDAGAARVVFDDETPRVVLAVTGQAPGALVRWQVFDIYGKKVTMGRAKPAPRVAIDGLPDTYGGFRLEACVERDGKPISPWDEVVWYRLRRPRYWGKDAPNSPFAVHTNSTTRHILMAKAIGINWTRLHDAGLQYFGWWNLESEKGKWRFFDRELKRYRQYGIKIFAELGTAPPWASYYQDSGLKTFGYFDKFFQPKDLADYANYVRVVCERYKNDIDAFDVWNEPWIHAWWGVAYDHEKGGRAGYITSEHPQADFARLMKVARDTARSVIPNAQVFGVNTTTGPTTNETHFSGSDWTRGVMEAGGLDNCDGIAYHAYTNGGIGYPNDSVEAGLAVAVGPIREKYGKVEKPIWMTEGSPLIYRMGNGMYHYTFPYGSGDNYLDSADRIARYSISMLANGVSRMFIYSMHSQGRYQLEPKQWNAFTTDEGYLHPSGAAESQVAWLLEDTTFAERIEIGKGLYAYLFAGKGRAVAALSSSPSFMPVPIPSGPGITATDLFGNPVPAGTKFTGRVVYLEAKSLDALRDVLAE